MVLYQRAQDLMSFRDEFWIRESYHVRYSAALQRVHVILIRTQVRHLLYMYIPNSSTAATATTTKSEDDVLVNFFVNAPSQ